MKNNVSTMSEKDLIKQAKEECKQLMGENSLNFSDEAKNLMSHICDGDEEALNDLIKSILKEFKLYIPYGIVTAYRIITMKNSIDKNNSVCFKIYEDRLKIAQLIFKSIADEYNSINYNNYNRIEKCPEMIFQNVNYNNEYEFIYIHNCDENFNPGSAFKVSKYNYNLNTDKIEKIGRTITSFPIKGTAEVRSVDFEFKTNNPSILSAKISSIDLLNS